MPTDRADLSNDIEMPEEAPVAADGLDVEVQSDCDFQDEETEAELCEAGEEELQNEDEAPIESPAKKIARHSEAPVQAAADEEEPETRAVLPVEPSQASQGSDGNNAITEMSAEAAVAEVAPKKNGPRLMIKEIILENFKSYGGKKNIGPFHKCFSSVVGPNGSGKSNTIDALLFVFGKRAKKIRLNKVSELIHSSKGHENLPSAKVTVLFQDIVDTGNGPNDYEIVEGSELAVSREAFRNNSSKYYLDGRPSNFTEVTALLRKRGIDLEHNRFLILQGEVEQISLMKPKAQSAHEEGLLEYLEDIIGSNRLVEPIQQAEEVVERLSETRQEKLNRLKVAEKEREALDGPRKEAEAWVCAERERLELNSIVAQVETRKCRRALVGLEEEYKSLQVHMDKHREKMQEYEKQVKTIEGEHNIHLEKYNACKEDMEKAAAEFKEFERLDVKFSEDIAFNEQKLQKLRQVAETEKEQSEKLLIESDQLAKDVPRKEKELESAERHRQNAQKNLEALFESLKGKAEELRPLKEKKEKELVPLQKRLTEVRKEVEVAQTEATLLKEKTSKVAEQIEEIRKMREEVAQKMQAREKEAKQVTQMKKERVELVTQAKQRITQVAKDVEKVLQEVATARTQAEEAKSAFEQEATRGQLIRAVQQQAKAGKLNGVHGRLGDLGTIGKKYDVAVSTACGLLDAIVVDSTDDAQAVIEFCRQNDLGRTSCIVLEKIRDRIPDMERAVQTPEKAPRLLDLIKPSKPEYKVAFFFALQQTLVANDLDHASRIAYQGKKVWRVVTLQGQLIDASGTMSGGGNNVASGGMKASVCQYSPEEVKQIIDNYERKNSELGKLRHEHHSLEEALRMTDKEIEEFDLRERKCTMDVDSYQKQLEAYDSRLKTMKAPQLSADEKSKLKELEKLIGSRSKELSEIHVAHHEVETEVNELHDQIMNIGGEEVKTAKWKVDEAAKLCEDTRKAIRKMQLDSEAATRNSQKAAEMAKKALDDHKACEGAIVKLKEEHAKLDDKAESVLTKYNDLKAGLIDKDRILTELREKRDHIIQEATSLKSAEVDLVAEVEEKTRVLRDCQHRVQAWAKKLVDLRKEHSELPLDIISDEALQQGAPKEGGTDIGPQAIAGDLDDEQLESVVKADIDARVLALEANLKNMRPNLLTIEEFRKADTEYKGRLKEFEDANAEREKARSELENLRQKRLEEFMEGFSVISMKLKEMYQMITLGGDAELELVDTLDPFSEGIHFSVRPPKKSWKQITNLSGGEKTLASLSLVFALHHYKPTPLYFMDEIDAALDFRNVSIIANYIKERTKNAQFIIISLRNHMFELADLLVGIYKTHDMSKSVAIQPDAFQVARDRPALQVMDSNVTASQKTGKKALKVAADPAKAVA
jgi:structural maintenance of chromosome 4